MMLEFFTDQLDRPDVQQLLALHFGTMRAISPPEACHVLAADGLSDPAIVFLTARQGAALAGIGALKLLGHGHGEVKSMRVAAEFLGRGVGRAILDRIVTEALGQGVHRLSLETGSTDDFASAIALYESSGFAPCAPFGGYCPTPFTRFYTRQL